MKKRGVYLFEALVSLSHKAYIFLNLAINIISKQLVYHTWKIVKFLFMFSCPKSTLENTLVLDFTL